MDGSYTAIIAILAVSVVIATERKNGSLKNLVDAEILFNIVQTDP